MVSNNRPLRSGAFLGEESGQWAAPPPRASPACSLGVPAPSSHLWPLCPSPTWSCHLPGQWETFPLVTVQERHHAHRPLEGRDEQGCPPGRESWGHLSSAHHNGTGSRLLSWGQAPFMGATEATICTSGLLFLVLLTEEGCWGPLNTPNIDSGPEPCSSSSLLLLTLWKGRWTPPGAVHVLVGRTWAEGVPGRQQ